MKSNGFLTIFVFIKIHLENYHFTFALRLRQNERNVELLSLVCGRFRFFFWRSKFASIYHMEKASHFHCPNQLVKKKHTVKPQWRS